MKLSDVEKQVFRKLISNPTLMVSHVNRVSPEDFTIPVIKQVMQAFASNPSAVQHYTPSSSFFEILMRDHVHQPEELEKVSNMLAGMASKPADPKDLDMLIRELKANRMCRSMAQVIQKVIPTIKPDSVESAYENLLKELLVLPLHGMSNAVVATVHEIHEALEERVMSYLEAAAAKVPACLKAFDLVMGGFAYGEFVVITAGTGQGKSNMMLWWAEQFVERGFNCLYVTIEMSYEETMNRYHSIQTGYSVLDIGHKRILPENQGDYFEKLIAASKEKEVRPAFLRECQTIKNRKDPKFALKIAKKYSNRKAKMFVVDMEAATPARIEQEMQRIMMDHKLDCVFVDFLNVMDPEFANKDRVRELTSISRSMKKLARKSGTVLFTAAQMDTTGLEGTQDEVLRPDMVKYAKAIAENADWMIAFHRTEEDKSMKQVRLQLAKHRHSSDCTALIEFDFGTMQAIDLGFAPGTFIPEGYNQIGDKIGTGAYASYSPAAEPAREPSSEPLPVPPEEEPKHVAATVDDALALISKTFAVRSVKEIKSEAKEIKAEIKAANANDAGNDGK